LSPEMLEWPLNVAVARSGDRTILIDAGIGMDPGLDLPQAGRLVRRLEAAGINLASLIDVVLTHMHMYHRCGLLIDGVNDRLRPNLRIHVAAAELKFWESPDFSRAVMPAGCPPALRRAAKRLVNDYVGQLRPFEEEHEVTPRVVVRRTGGHTPGHSVVRPAAGGDRPAVAGGRRVQGGFEKHSRQDRLRHPPGGAAPLRR